MDARRFLQGEGGASKTVGRRGGGGVVQGSVVTWGRWRGGVRVGVCVGQRSRSGMMGSTVCHCTAPCPNMCHPKVVMCRRAAGASSLLPVSGPFCRGFCRGWVAALAGVVKPSDGWRVAPGLGPPVSTAC